MAIQRLRPEAKPERVSALEWEKSKCDKSPTGSHWFVPDNGLELWCRFCGKSHTEVWSTGQKSKKGRALGRPRKRPGNSSRGRPRKAKVKEALA